MKDNNLISSIGFVMCLIGAGGMAEAYGFNKSLAISLTLIIIGGLLIFVGDMKHDTENFKRSDNSNVLDRLYFLRK